MERFPFPGVPIQTNRKQSDLVAREKPNVSNNQLSRRATNVYTYTRRQEHEGNRSSQGDDVVTEKTRAWLAWPRL